MGSAVAERLEGRAVDKVAQRRSELAAAALKTLSELGYARTSCATSPRTPSSPTASCTTTSATRST